MDHGGILGRSLNEPQRVLDALTVDADRCHQHEIITNVDAVNLHHQEVQAEEIRSHPRLHALSR